MRNPAEKWSTRHQYGSHPRQFGDLRVPQVRQAFSPVVITIHGGFWRSAYGLDHIEPAAIALAEAGFATWNIEYRCIGTDGGWPVTFDDVAAAVKWVDGPTIAVGHSAGGHLALLLAHHGLVSAAVSLAGVADLRGARELNLSKGVVAEFMGAHPDRDASPIELPPARVPVRLIHGLDDDIVPHEISAAYAAAVRQAGADVELLSLAGTGHFELVDPHSAQWPEVLSTVVRLATDKLTGVQEKI
jgi:acetyl esterase/lipase